MERNRSNHLRVTLRTTGGASMHPVLYLERRIAGEDGARSSFRITRGSPDCRYSQHRRRFPVTVTARN